MVTSRTVKGSDGDDEHSARCVARSRPDRRHACRYDRCVPGALRRLAGAEPGRHDCTAPAPHQPVRHVLDRSSHSRCDRARRRRCAGTDAADPSSRKPSFSTTRRLAVFSGRIVASIRCSPRPKKHWSRAMDERGRDDAAAGEGLVDPVADLRGPGRAPDDAADGELAREVIVVGDDPRQGLPAPGLAPHRPRHRHVRTQAGAVERRLRVGRLPGPQPGRVAHPGVPPERGVLDLDGPQTHRLIEQPRLS